MLIAAIIAIAFLAGSIPFGLLIGKARGIDIRQHGSKNIGSTNCGRVLGTRFGVACFVLDFLKGLLPTLGAGLALGTLGRLDVPIAAACAWLAVVLAAVLGHMFSPWVGFKGGKGVATGFGALMGVWPVLTIPAIGALLVWFVLVKTTRYMGLSSCVAALTLPIGAAAFGPLAAVLGLEGWKGLPSLLETPGSWPFWPHLGLVSGLAALVVFKHRGNLKRMLDGTELRLGGARTTS